MSNNSSCQFILLNIKNGKSGSWSIDATYYDFSKDGSRLCIAYPSCILVYNVLNASLVINLPVDSASVVYCIKCIDNDHFAFVMDHSVCLLDCNNQDKFEQIATIDDSLTPESIIDIQINLESKYCLLRADNDGMGFIQFGKLYEKGCVFNGMAGCLCSLNTCYMKGDVVILFRQSASDANTFILCTSALSSDSLHFHKGSFHFSEISKENRPEYCFVDPETGFVFIITHDGTLMLWDVVTGSFIDSMRVMEHNLLCGIGTENGVIGIPKGSTLVQKWVLNETAVLEKVLSFPAEKLLAALLVASRVDTTQTEDDLLSEFLWSLFEKDAVRLGFVLRCVLNGCGAVDMPRVVEAMLTTPRAEAVLGRVAALWRAGELLAWQTAVAAALEEFTQWRDVKSMPATVTEADSLSVANSIQLPLPLPGALPAVPAVPAVPAITVSAGKEKRVVRSPPLLFAARVNAIRRCLELLSPEQATQATQATQEKCETMLAWLFEEEEERALAEKLLASSGWLWSVCLTKRVQVLYGACKGDAEGRVNRTERFLRVEGQSPRILLNVL